MTKQPTRLRILLLGGTTEASALAGMLAGRDEFKATLSLAGRTANPSPAPIPTRTGGFGGQAGLIDYINREQIDVMVDATHPFAAQMSRNAVAAGTAIGCALIAIERPAWKAVPGDSWRRVPDVGAAIAAVGAAPRRVLMAIGRQQLAMLKAAPHHHYVIRVIDPPESPPDVPDFKLIQARGPFTVEGEKELFRREKIDVLVTKNSGGVATSAKLEAARLLGIPVIMVERPEVPSRATVASAAEAIAFLAFHHWFNRDHLANRGV